MSLTPLPFLGVSSLLTGRAHWRGFFLVAAPALNPDGASIYKALRQSRARTTDNRSRSCFSRAKPAEGRKAASSR